MKQAVLFPFRAFAILVAMTAPLGAQVAPSIVTQPEDLTILSGDYIFFTVLANGTEPLTYQWRKNGSSISGATDEYFWKDPSTTADAGAYTCKVSNSSGSVTSAVATLTVYVPPAITTQPVGKTILAGSNVTFTVKATGSTPLTYQWFRDNVPIEGATSTNLTLLGAQPADEGDYTVAVGNPAVDYGADYAISPPATLTVWVPPMIFDHPEDVEVTEGDSVLFSVLADGTDTEACPLTFQWLFKGNYIIGETDTLLEVFDVTPSDAGDYRVIVANNAGIAVSSNAYLTVNTPPVFTLHPASRTVYPGSNMIFYAQATGTQPITYQWYYNDAAIEGATNTSYSVFIAGTAQRGKYNVVAENVADDEISNDAILIVKAETVKPTVAITFPTEGMRLSNAPVTVLGVAADNAAVDYVEYADHFEPNGLGFLMAMPVPVGSGLFTWTNWTATFVPPVPGTNLVRAVATDDSDNRSTTASVNYFYVVPSPFTLVTNGPGVASTNLGQNLEVGRDYTLTALPGPGAVFTNWTGGYTTNHPTLRFMMKSNLVLNMNFVDVQNPTITVTNPLPNGPVSSSLAVVGGAAADNWRVTAVWYQFNSNAWALASGTSNWSAAVNLVTGTNTFRAYSLDAAGRASTTNTSTGVVTVAPPRPVVTGLVRAGGTANVSFTTVNGLLYNLEFKNTLTDAVWTELTPAAPGTGGVVTLPDTNAPPASRYYRVRAQ